MPTLIIPIHVKVACIKEVQSDKRKKCEKKLIGGFKCVYNHRELKVANEMALKITLAYD